MERGHSRNGEVAENGRHEKDASGRYGEEIIERPLET